MKKVLDIWIKAGTFSTDVLTRLSDLAKGSEPDQGAYFDSCLPKYYSTFANATHLACRGDSLSSIRKEN